MDNKFKYIGEYPLGQSHLDCFGVTFRPDEIVEVPAKFIGKARGNRFFVACEAKPADELKAEPKTEPANGSPQLGMTKEELIAKAEEFDIKIDKRWSASKIADAIIAHSKDA